MSGSGEGSTEEQWILQVLLYRESLSSALTLTMSPCKSLVLPVHSQISTGAQSEQVHHCEKLLVDVAPLRGVCCYCSLGLTTHPVGTGQPRILALFYLLPLQDVFLDFSLVVWLVHLDSR